MYHASNILVEVDSSYPTYSRNFPMKHYLYDSEKVRYELYQTNGGKNYNWLFFPGGPGADSSYLCSLLEGLNLPGNSWLIDLPGNGNNDKHFSSDDFDCWFELFPRIVKHFDHPIVVGHSFGGMLPLLYPELENILKGCVILNSAPKLWLEEAVAYSKQFDLPNITEDMQDFIQNPTQESFNTALNACMPYYFPKETLIQGRLLLSRVPFQYRAAVWGQIKALEGNLSAKWIPHEVPTLIMGAKYDCICPFSLFKNDSRFQRENIKLVFIENAGHCPWIENPLMVDKAFNEFTCSLK
jgi:pimeloyl-ACP methyl ester carboxylesterase